MDREALHAAVQEVAESDTTEPCRAGERQPHVSVKTKAQSWASLVAQQ